MRLRKRSDREVNGRDRRLLEEGANVSNAKQSRSCKAKVRASYNVELCRPT